MGCRRAMETDVCTLYDAKKGTVQPTTVTLFICMHAACIRENYPTNFLI